MNTNMFCMNCMTGKLNEAGVCMDCNADNKKIQTTSRHLPLRTILNGKYLIGKVLGEGGFGITYIGYDLNLEIRVAIKEFCPIDCAGRDNMDRMTILPFGQNNEEIFENEKNNIENK